MPQIEQTENYAQVDNDFFDSLAVEIFSLREFDGEKWNYDKMGEAFRELTKELLDKHKEKEEIKPHGNS